MASYLAQKKAIKKYQQKNREKLLEYRRQYRLKNIEKCRQQTLINTRKTRLKQNIENNIFGTYMQGILSQ
jgi:hypothetical protein